jgi:hypothetical protein
VDIIVALRLRREIPNTTTWKSSVRWLRRREKWWEVLLRFQSFFSINFGVKKGLKIGIGKNCAVWRVFRKKWRLKTMDEKVLQLVLKAKFWTNASPYRARAAS